MPPLKKPEHERFAQEIAKGATLGAAYVAAGYAKNDKNAARLKKRPDVQARITELQERTAEKATTTAADIAKQLDEDRTFARELKQSAAAVSATMGKAKVLGLVIDRQKHSFDLAGLSDEDLARLEDILARASKS